MNPHGSRFIRGFVLTAVAMFAPIAAAAFTMAIGIAAGWEMARDYALTGAIWWAWLLIPYWWLRPVLASSALGVMIATVQWFTVAAAIGVGTRRANAWVTLVIVTASVVGVGAIVLVALRLFGHRPVFEGP